MKIFNREKLKQKENKLSYGTFYNNSNYICRKENGDHITNDSLKYLSRVVNYQLRLGHSKLATTMDTYSHVTSKLTNQTVNIIESLTGNSKI